MHWLWEIPVRLLIAAFILFGGIMFPVLAIGTGDWYWEVLWAIAWGWGACNILLGSPRTEPRTE